MNEMERVKRDLNYFLVSAESKMEYPKGLTYSEMVDQILSIKGFAILSDDQELPDMKHGQYFKEGITSDADLDKFARTIELIVKTEFLKKDWRRIVNASQNMQGW